MNENETPQQPAALEARPEPPANLARPDMRQLSQRITARFHLTPLDADETAAYLRHRSRIAGRLG